MSVVAQCFMYVWKTSGPFRTGTPRSGRVCVGLGNRGGLHTLREQSGADEENRAILPEGAQELPHQAKCKHKLNVSDVCDGIVGFVLFFVFHFRVGLSGELG